MVLATGLPTAISNDVQALTVAHHWFGAGRGTGSLAVLAVGAGVGAGLVLDGELLRGAHGRPGKVSHLVVTADGPRCDHGHLGCASAYVTVPAVLRAAGAAGGADFDDVLQAAAAGEPRADRALRAAGTALGALAAHLVNLVDPEKVVVTGEGRAVGEYARADLDAALLERLDPSVGAPPVEVHPFAFTDYAWGAAITAIRTLVGVRAAASPERRWSRDGLEP